VKFFIAKLTFKNGDVSHPLSLFAENMRSALARLEEKVYADELTQIIVRERSLAEASVGYGRTSQETDIKEHHDIEWWPED